MSCPVMSFYKFGPFRLDVLKRLLLRDGEVVPLTSKAFETLLALVERRGEILGKEELLSRIWPDAVVEEKNLTINISALRKTLGESPQEHRYIVTVPGRGYRFVADVQEVADEEAGPAQESAHPVFTAEAARTQPGEKIRPRFTSSRRLILAAGVTLMALGAVGFFWWKPSSSPMPQTGLAVRSMAVLPFKSLSAAESDEYLGLGLADALITRLGRVSQIIVRPTSAVRKFTAPGQDPRAAGRELKVESVLEGTIQRVDDRVRLTLQLISVADGRHLWAEQFDEKFTDILTVEDRISQRVAVALSLKLTGAEQSLLAKHHTENSEAHQLYLKGRYFWNKRTPEGIRKSIEFIRQATDLDPSYAAAFAGLADCYLVYPLYVGQPPGDWMQQARAAAAKALELDAALAEAHATLAFIKMLYDWDWAGAEQEFKQALTLNPNYPTAHQWYANWFSWLGRADEAIATAKRAQELDPLSLVISADLGGHLYRARRYDEAIAQFRKTLELDPTFAPARLELGQVYLQKKLWTDAIAELQQGIALADESHSLPFLGYAYGVAGRQDAARQTLTRLQPRIGQRYVFRYYLALIQLGLREKMRPSPCWRKPGPRANQAWYS
jgi:DNA-binding winged helix-turn-helix (wHTH) protein/TolB-like protein